MAGRPDRGQISEAIRRAKAFVLILSRKSDQSRQVLWEVERAAHSRLRLIAFQIEDFEPGDNLGYFSPWFQKGADAMTGLGQLYADG